ncbi:hypothetical protein [Amorphus orientalis]|uniref:Uncharacterized protein n=1 Tax=Amorphus orientalis TaxID=649198 RepID=A0AAE4AUT4_9HYPH|nr:hypothetical protein [Amorphus orientalis]MDQ0317760.1 hypothetical protein [Amorphus orientalis]
MVASAETRCSICPDPKPAGCPNKAGCTAYLSKLGYDVRALTAAAVRRCEGPRQKAADQKREALARLASAPLKAFAEGIPPGFPEITLRQLCVLRLIFLMQGEKGEGVVESEIAANVRYHVHALSWKKYIRVSAIGGSANNARMWEVTDLGRQLVKDPE